MGTRRVVIDPNQLAAIRSEVLRTIRSMRGTTASPPADEDPEFLLGMDAGVELVERVCELRFEVIRRDGIQDDQLGWITGQDQPKQPKPLKIS